MDHTHMHMHMHMCMHMCNMSLHALVLYTLMGHKKEAARPVYGLCCCRAGRAVSAAVRPLCAVGLSGSCQAVTLGPDSDGTPLMSGSAVRLSDTCCQAVRESAVNAVRLSGTVRRCPGFAVRLSDQGSGSWTATVATSTTSVCSRAVLWLAAGKPRSRFASSRRLRISSTRVSLSRSPRHFGDVGECER